MPETSLGSEALQWEFQIFGNILEESERYPQMPLDSRLQELRKLYSRLERLSSLSKEFQERAIVLENMPDIIEKRIRLDSYAMAFLQRLKGSGNLPYDLLGAIEDDITAAEHYVDLFETVGLVKIVHPQNDPSYGVTGVTGRDSIIELTEKGRLFHSQ